ncbi:hypothetical protein [Arthrobacter sp. UM1]|uniref:hypothetical protein n=1 Tax=Arthrobacter sp. UM1 TaxID=2766776 RepID=UPI001CF63956|nr:hypothetical protein [Arthrobacter sp. UM1]MCB4207231.1 hypothetical protein [Arthrobacter sp. UM1]
MTGAAQRGLSDGRRDAALALSRQHWGQLRDGTAASLALAVLACSLWLTPDRAAAPSAMLGIGIVWASFAVSAVILALAARRAPDSLVLLGMGLYVLKFFVVAVLFLMVGIPSWASGIWVGAGALAAVAAWQLVQFRSVGASRVPLYSSDEDA